MFNVKTVILLTTILGISVMMQSCTRPMGYTHQPMQTYDHNTEYKVDEQESGFTITVYYRRYQFIPESDSVAIACKSCLTSIAYEVAEARGRKIKPINEQRIKLSMGRNGFTGITSCSATVPVEYE